MKRMAERDMASPKRPRSAFETRLLIPSKMAGSVIGKAGSNINRLRSENKAQVSLPDSQGSPERLITIGADDQDTVLNVVTQILQLVQDDIQKEDSESPSEVRALFHHSQVGSIIGKGGAKIKELRETANAQIKVYGNVCPRSTDRVVQINGSVDSCVETLGKCMVLVNETTVKGPVDRYDPFNFDEYHAMEYGGYGEPRGGGGGDYYRGPPRGPPRGFSRSRGRGGGGGERSSGGMHRGERSDSGSRRNGNGFGGDGPPREFGTATISSGSGDESSCQVTIPNEYAGAIIGKGGTRIRRIRADSGAGITIAEPNQGQTERIITITGSQGQIRMAQYLLQQSVKEHL